MSEELQSIVQLAVDAARMGGRIAASAFATRETTVRYKGEIDLVTETDLRVEEALRTALRPAGVPVLGEERADETDRSALGDLFFVVDPIDGTTNFAHRIPHYAISIGVWSEGEPRGGVIYDPSRDELFATWGDGATFNGDALPALKSPPLDRALLATGFPYDRRTNHVREFAIFEDMVVASQGVRRNGSAALDLAWVACGRVDGFFEARLQPWDVSAGVALVTTLGGRVTDYRQDPLPLDKSDIVAAHPALHAELLRVIRKHDLS